MTDTYGEWADIYDSVFSYVKHDVVFYVEEARRSGGPVLELGCGTGRIAIPIAQSGVEIVGLDLSASMLEVAQCKLDRLPELQGSLALVQADMRDFALNEQFGLIIIPFRGFLSLLTVEDEVKALSNIRRHLAPGGRFVLDIFMPDLDMLVQESDVPYHFADVTDPETGKKLILWQQSHYDRHHQIIRVRMMIDELDMDDTVCRRLYRGFELRCVHRWEMYHLLKVCGFNVLELLGDFGGSAFCETSTEMVWIADAPS